MRFDVVITGDRFAAYAAAAILARRGRSTCVVPDPDPVCGRARITVRDGFILDLGVMAERAAGLEPEAAMSAAGIAPKFFSSGRTTYYNGAKTHVVPFAPAQALASRMLGPTAKKTWASILLKLKRMKSDSAPYDMSMGDWVGEMKGADADVAEAASVFGAAGWDSPDFERLPVSAFAEAARERPFRVSSVPLGGWARAFSALESVIKNNGTVLEGSKLEKIIIEDGTARGVEADGGRIEADFVVVCAQNPRLRSLGVDELLKDEYRDALMSDTPVSGLSLDLGVEGRVTDSASSIITLEPFTHGMAVSNIEPSLAPRGCQLLSWFAPAPKVDLDDPEKVRNMQVRIKDILGLLFPGVMENIIVERWRAAETVSAGAPRATARVAKPSPSAFTVPNLLLLNDSLNYSGRKGEPALKAALDLPAFIDRLPAAK